MKRFSLALVCLIAALAFLATGTVGKAITGGNMGSTATVTAEDQRGGGDGGDGDDGDSERTAIG